MNTTTPRHKEVRFSERRNKHYRDLVRHSLHDCQGTWYTLANYTAMVTEFRQTLDHAVRRERRRRSARRRCPTQQEDNPERMDPSSCAALFSETLERLLNVITPIDYVLENASILMTPEIETYLSTLYQSTTKRHTAASSSSSKDKVDDTLVGLEFYFPLGILRRECKKRRTLMQLVVQDIQREHRQGLWPNDSEYDQELHDSCRNYSQTFTLFAQFLGHAHEAAAILVYEESITPHEEPSRCLDPNDHQRERT